MEGEGVYNLRTSLYVGLVVGFALTIVLQAWFVRRLAALSDAVREARSESRRLNDEGADLAERSQEMERGLTTNASSIDNLRGEIQKLRKRAEGLATENPELRRVYEEAAANPADESPSDDPRD